MDDLVSRQAVLDLVIANHTELNGLNVVMYSPFYKDIKQLPPVKPQEPKTGHWISHYDEDAKEGWYECDRCHTERAFNTDFCPDCGCRMVEPQESEEVNG